MIVGINTDIRHRGTTFHVQTEDSGPSNPILVTHVFVGGFIIETRRAEYADLLNTSDWEETVRQRMRGQHREVAEALRQGDFNDAIKRAGRGGDHGDIPLARDAKRSRKRGKNRKRSARSARSKSPPAPSPPPPADAALPPPVVDGSAPPLDLPPPTTSAPPPGLDAAEPRPPPDAPLEYRTPLTEGAPLDRDRLAWFLDDP